MRFHRLLGLMALLPLVALTACNTTATGDRLQASATADSGTVLADVGFPAGDTQAVKNNMRTSVVRAPDPMNPNQSAFAGGQVDTLAPTEAALVRAQAERTGEEAKYIAPVMITQAFNQGTGALANAAYGIGGFNDLFHGAGPWRTRVRVDQRINGMGMGMNNQQLAGMQQTLSQMEGDLAQFPYFKEAWEAWSQQMLDALNNNP